ncbi:DNA polymerase IV [Acetobacter sp. AN02]|uniref:DNA polymerase IV n=1 Tax=Acetobacter sp. AN02 TaxID=2894186 RepID=UPI0024346745|nr:DNA polymerase IV [Acetobacter sp. AN02]MDG6094941.1 DNA polymerase IV [Acetobacter sp. AN02]
MERKIIHVDMDAFYASVEQRDCPELRGRPVAVGSAGARGVVAAASYEARVSGVRSALPSVTALKRCPELIFVRPRFQVYRSVSRQIHNIFLDFSDVIEPLSLDEAYLDVTENKAGVSTAWRMAKLIRARILEQTGLTASAGVSYNKLLAKLASGMRKPDGQFAIMPDEGAGFIGSLPVGKLHGVGRSTAARMHELGIFTGADLRRRAREELRLVFGKAGLWYYDVARGVDNRPVRSERVRKSSGSETTFPEDYLDEDRIRAGLAEMADEVWGWCETAQRFGRTVTVKVKWADFRITTRSQSFSAPVRSREALMDAAERLLRGLLPPPAGVRLVGVTVSGFAGAESRQPDLLDCMG